jgi:hypothetical protein
MNYSTDIGGFHLVAVNKICSTKLEENKPRKIVAKYYYSIVCFVFVGWLSIKIF